MLGALWLFWTFIIGRAYLHERIGQLALLGDRSEEFHLPKEFLNFDLITVSATAPMPAYARNRLQPLDILNFACGAEFSFVALISSARKSTDSALICRALQLTDVAMIDV